jgi:WD40 repeat protein
LAVSPDGSQLALGGELLVAPADPGASRTREPNIRIIDLQQRKISKLIKGDAMGPLVWSHDGLRLAVTGESFVEIFDARSGGRLVHEKLETSANMNARFTRDGRYFIESDMNGRGTGLGVKIWDSQRRKLLQEIPGNIASIDVSQDGKYLAVGGVGRTSIWQFK